MTGWVKGLWDGIPAPVRHELPARDPSPRSQEESVFRLFRYRWCVAVVSVLSVSACGSADS